VVVGGEELKREREKLEMTQQELADALSVHIMTVSRWERGVRAIPAHLSLALEALKARVKKKR
jgi:transcriptional regulator with XRE-family HTH domain